MCILELIGNVEIAILNSPVSFWCGIYRRSWASKSSSPNFWSVDILIYKFHIQTTDATYGRFSHSQNFFREVPRMPRTGISIIRTTALERYHGCHVQAFQSYPQRLQKGTTATYRRSRHTQSIRRKVLRLSLTILWWWHSWYQFRWWQLTV